MRKVSLAVVIGLIATVLSIGLAPGAGAEVGGRVETGVFYLQGAEVDGQLVFAWTEPFEGSVTACADLGCEDTSTALIPGFESLTGYALAGNGAVVGGIDDGRSPAIADCSNPACTATSGLRPAPQSGELFVAPDGSLVIVDRNKISTCPDISCTSSTTDSTPESLGVAMDPTNGDLVFLTGSELIRCGTASCDNAQRSSHGLDAVESLAIDTDGYALITLRSDAEDDAFIPQLARCQNSGCTSSSIETLTDLVTGRTSLDVIAGSVDRVMAWISAASRGNVITAPAGCFKTVDGTAVNLTFDGDVGRAAHLRVNGKWTANVTGSSSRTLDPGRLSDEIVIRHWFGSESVDVSCEAITTPPPPLAAECVFTRDGDRVTLFFESSTESTNLRRNGKWLDSVRQRTSYVDNGAPANASYELVRRVAGERITYDCVAVDSASCSLEVIGNGVNVEWSNTGVDNVVLRKNGRWLSSPQRGDSSYLDPGGSTGDTYLMRLWSDPNTFVDVACS